MNVTPGIGTSGEPEFRAPLYVSLQFIATAVAPHASTSRGTYTVPANRKAIIQTARVNFIVTTVHTTVGKTEAWLNYTPNGGTLHHLVYETSFNVAVNSGGMDRCDEGIILSAGDALDLRTADASVGGSDDYDCAVSILEFAG